MASRCIARASTQADRIKRKALRRIMANLLMENEERGRRRACQSAERSAAALPWPGMNRATSRSALRRFETALASMTRRRGPHLSGLAREQLAAAVRGEG